MPFSPTSFLLGLGAALVVPLFTRVLRPLAVEAAVDTEVARIARDGVTNDELEKAKDRYVRSMIFARDKQDDMANMYGETLASGGNVQDVQEWPDHIRKVTTDDVKAAAARYLVFDHSTTGYLLPQTQVEN